MVEKRVEYDRLRVGNYTRDLEPPEGMLCEQSTYVRCVRTVTRAGMTKSHHMNSLESIFLSIHILLWFIRW